MSVYIKNAISGQETCVIRMFGITAESNSVAVHVHNFTPYFYVKVNTAVNAHFQAEDLVKIRDQLNRWILGNNNSNSNSDQN